MFKDHASSAMAPVSDIDRARDFYSGKLGLELEGEAFETVLTYKTGKTRLLVYVSGEAGTNRANTAAWGCGDDFDAVMTQLEDAGVRFERYPDLPGMTLDGNVHTAGPMRGAWFKDPDGNILHINNM